MNDIAVRIIGPFTEEARHVFRETMLELLEFYKIAPKCKECEKLLEGEEALLRTDPYLSDVYEVYALCYLCDNCYGESCAAI